MVVAPPTPFNVPRVGESKCKPPWASGAAANIGKSSSAKEKWKKRETAGGVLRDVDSQKRQAPKDFSKHQGLTKSTNNAFYFYFL